MSDLLQHSPDSSFYAFDLTFDEANANAPISESTADEKVMVRDKRERSYQELTENGWRWLEK
ncbi:hypothetical protein I3842_01G255500 [Carya illinoinensis]|uniref:Uncharacterized protein n=1 Tax=Carya illinoinensis TaxID=32201 RepID=A0A922GBW5_CARIL|nr:hypothetical protein I3842_01G255500 [Carya illinoinensis]